MAQKKAGGSSRNGRDSAGRRLGVKAHRRTIRTRRQHPGAATGHTHSPRGKTSVSAKTIPSFAMVDGVVRFETFGGESKRAIVVPLA